MAYNVRRLHLGVSLENALEQFDDQRQLGLGVIGEKANGLRGPVGGFFLRHVRRPVAVSLVDDLDTHRNVVQLRLPRPVAVARVPGALLFRHQGVHLQLLVCVARVQRLRHQVVRAHGVSGGLRQDVQRAPEILAGMMDHHHVHAAVLVGRIDHHHAAAARGAAGRCHKQDRNQCKHARYGSPARDTAAGEGNNHSWNSHSFRIINSLLEAKI